MYPNKSVDECFSDQRTYSKSPQGMSAKDVRRVAFTGSGVNIYESGRTDSGFLSGANLVSEQNLSSDDLCLLVSHKSEHDLDNKSKKNSDVCVRLDSGVDVGLNEQFSELTLQQKVQLKDVNASADKKYLLNPILSPRCFVKLVKRPTNSESSVHSTSLCWEYCFQQDDDGDTQLHNAIIYGCTDGVDSLIRMAPHPHFLDIPNDRVQSPLHLAVLMHQARIVRQLIIAGADIERRDRHGNTPLHLACEMGDLDCVIALTKMIAPAEVAGADLLYSGFTQRIPQDFEEKNYEGETCLHLAAYGGHLEILRYLIRLGADVNAREGKSGRTVLHFSVETGKTKLLRFLLDECPMNGLLIDTPDYAGRTAYQLACVINSSIATALLEKGANFEVEDISEDDHPDHNNEDEDEITMMDNVFSNMEYFQRSREVVPV